MQKKNLIKRERNNPDDQRVVELYLTQEGIRLLATAPRPAQGVLADVLMRLPDKSLVHLENGLSEFIKILKTFDEQDALKPIDT